MSGLDVIQVSRLENAIVHLYRSEKYLDAMARLFAAEFPVTPELSKAIFNAMDRAYDDGVSSND